jgi:DNA-binding GntR family transcriptional regulator
VPPVFRSKNALVYDALKESILQGDLKPGQRVVIDELAHDLGVSQIPVREALRMLEADGLVRIEAYVGATVSDIHAGLTQEIFALLAALESISSRAACTRLSPDQFDQLQAIITQMDALTDQPDRWSAENKRLHAFICECAGMPLVASMMNKTLDHWDRLRRHYQQDVFAHRIAVAQREHHRLLAAFKTGDADAVQDIVRQHNQAALQAYLREEGPLT